MATIKERFQQAKDLFESRGTDAASLQEAELLCNGVIEANAKHAKAHQLLGMIAWRRGRMEEAEKLLRQAEALKGPDGYVKACLAVVRKCRSAPTEEVSRLYREAVSLAPESATVAVMAGAFLQSQDQMHEAQRMFEKAVALEPDQASPHYKLGKCLHRMKRLPEARRAFEHALRLDPGHERASFWLAALRTEMGETAAVPPAAPADYVAKLFDGYAPRFDEHLTQQLGYRTPRLLMDLVLASLRSSSGGEEVVRFESAVDLGCGTGLSGEALRPHVTGRLSGVDLSGGMLEKARERAIYQDLHRTDIVTALQPPPPPPASSSCSEPPSSPIGRFSLFFAADVLVYLGDVRPLFAACRSAASHPHEAVLAFSTEAWLDAPLGSGCAEAVGYKLQHTGRYSHSADYLRATAEAEGWQVLSLTSAAIRRQRGEDVIGHLAVLRLQPPATTGAGPSHKSQSPSP